MPIMRVATGTVAGGKVVVDAESWPEGSTVTVLLRYGEEIPS
jgi:hypothetical protein